MNNNVDISLIVALRSGVQLALKHIQRLLVVIGIVVLSTLVAGALSAPLMLLVTRISANQNFLLVTNAALFVLVSVVVHGFVLWYFKEILRIVRGHTRSFPELKQSIVRGWQLFTAQVLFYSIVYLVDLLFAYPFSYFSLSKAALFLLAILLSIPALYLAARLCLYPFFLADGKGAIDSLRASFMVTSKHVIRLIPIGAGRMLLVGRILAMSFVSMALTIHSFFKISLVLIAVLFIGAIIDLASAHIYQRLTHPDQAAVPPGVHPLD